MKNRNGFTLTELLAIIVLLSLLVVFVFPKIIEIVEKKQTEIDDATLDLIYSGVDEYMRNNKNDFPKTIGVSYCVSINTLNNENLVPVDLRKYKTKFVEVKIGKRKNSYKINDTCGDILTITFDAKGGKLDEESKNVEVGNKIELPEPNKTGYIFIGWFTESEGGVEVTNNTEWTESKKIYAHYTKISYTVTLSVISGNAQQESLNILYGGKKSVTITPDSGYYLYVGSCSNGYKIKNMNVGPSYTGPQTITIDNNSKLTDSTCTFEFTK